MPYKDKEKQNAFQKAYYQAHREERKAQNKAYNKAHREEKKAYMKSYNKAHKEEQKAWRQAHREEKKAYNKAYYQANREEMNAYQKAYNQAHREEQKAYHKAWEQAHREEMNAYHKAYKKSDTNSLGHTKNSIRAKSSRYLFNVLKHTKLKGYEIHHCFGYNDYRNFIYIPKSLHIQIHQFLRDNSIDADTDHYNKIVHLINACEEYVYIKA